MNVSDIFYLTEIALQESIFIRTFFILSCYTIYKLVIK
jgi:hypothetical protein